MINYLKEKNLDEVITSILGSLLLFTIIMLVIAATMNTLNNIISSLIAVPLISVGLILTLQPILTKILKLNKYYNEKLNKALGEKFPEILDSNFRIQDNSLSMQKQGVLIVKDKKISFFGNYYLFEDTKNYEKRFEENFEYAISILNNNKKIKA